MKAIVRSVYGPPDVLQLNDVAKPVPKHNEVLIKVCATTVTTADGMMRRGESLASRIIMGFGRPRKRYRIPGLELAGRVEVAGRDVKRFRAGDQVFGFTGFGPGAHAEYTCAREDASLAVKPFNVSYGEAAALVDGASTALYFLRDKAHIRRGQRILIIGASGSIGTSAVQLAKYFGAEVTGVCGTAHAELVKSLGADKVIDYSQEDFTRSADAYDVVFDTVGKSSFSRCKGSLTENGCYLVTVMGLVPIFQTLWTRMRGGKRVIFGLSVKKGESLAFLKGLIEDGKLRAVVDRRYPLEQIAEAHRYVDKGHKHGSVVITLCADE